ncbi:MAG: xanthine dehydrogenase family protein [Anaerolineae bacterium]|nr:xanthine dehydrogenase family protein [Anaerolineae bacterium]
MKVVGQSVQRFDIATKVTGGRKYPQDFNREGQLYAAVVWAKHPHARVVGIDVGKALTLPHVIDVITAQDVPVNEYGIDYFDQQVFIPVGGTAKWTGDRIAVVVAETEAAARQAAALVKVDYEPLAVVSDPREALKDEVLVHPERGSNLLKHLFIRRGDVDAALARADVIVEGHYETPCIEHAYLQPEACLGYIDEDGRLALIVATQWPQDDIRQLAHIFDLPEEQIRVLVPAVGGAFGGREDMSLQPLVAAAVFKLRRPVKMVWTREESIQGHGKRHRFWLDYKTACAHDGTLLAIEARCVSDAGAYESTSLPVLSNAVSFLGGPYVWPACKIDGYTAYTNNAPGMAMRGFGGAQAPIGHELQIDKLARAIGMDPVEFRLKNILVEGSTALTGNAMPPGTGMKECLEAAARAAGWVERDGHWHKPQAEQPAAPYKRRGIGIACAYKNVGYSFAYDDRSTARIEIKLTASGEIDHVLVRMAAVEVGQGVFTALSQIAAEALDVPIEKVRFAFVDTSTSPNAGSCSASRHTYASGNAVYDACQEALAQREAILRAETGERHIVAEYTYRARTRRPTTTWDPATGECDPHISYGFGAQAVLLDVDVETGEIDLLKLWAANDIGKAINPAMVYGQSAGGAVMGLGYALSEEIIHRDGRLRTRRFSEFHVPTALDIPPEFVDIQIEKADPTGPYGATGLGETPLMPTTPAVLDAIADATGVYLSVTPATPERVWLAMKKNS